MKDKSSNKISQQDFDDAYQLPIDYRVNGKIVHGHLTCWKEDIDYTEPYITKARGISNTKCFIQHGKLGKLLINKSQDEMDRIIFTQNYNRNKIGFKFGNNN